MAQLKSFAGCGPTMMHLTGCRNLPDLRSNALVLCGFLSFVSSYSVLRTMTTYTVTVILDAKWVRQFRNGKMNLCTAFGVTSNYSKVSYNVIATHEGI